MNLIVITWRGLTGDISPPTMSIKTETVVKEYLNAS
jgi:hypothetical protein